MDFFLQFLPFVIGLVKLEAQVCSTNIFYHSAIANRRIDITLTQVKCFLEKGQKKDTVHS